MSSWTFWPFVLKAWCFFVSCFWLVLFWPLWLFWVSTQDYFLSDPTATNSWEIIFPTPIEMLWIGGKGFLFAIIGHSPMESFSELILIFKLTKWFDIRVLICQKSLTWIYTIFGVFSTSSKFQNLVVISVKLLIIVQCLTNPLFSRLSSSSMCLNLSRSILSMSSSSGSEEDKLCKIITNWC